MKKTLTKPRDQTLGVRFTKMTGTGNDFLIFDARETGFPKFDRPLFVKSICRRSFSVGADGVVFIEKPKGPQTTFKWDFYNADGSFAEMCGNASRCVARYAFENGFAGREVSFETSAGVIEAKVLTSGIVEVEMPPSVLLEKKAEIPLGEHLKISVLYINTGVPHVVKEEDDWGDEYLHDMGRHLRSHEKFKKTNGTNVTFYEKVEGSIIHSATYERGVEAVTPACGTGAVAAAFAAALSGVPSPIEVRVPGGTLHVDLDLETMCAVLAGEARFICEGRILPEALL